MVADDRSGEFETLTLQPGDPGADRKSSLIFGGLDALPDLSVIMFDLDFTFLLVRGKALHFTGFRADELEGQLAHEALSPPRWAFYEPMYRNALQGISSSMEVSSPDGQRTYLVKVGPFHDSLGLVAGGIAVATDVTEHTLALTALRDSEDRFRLLAENSSDFVLRTSDHGVIEWVSPSVVGMTGWDPSELIGRLEVDFVHPDEVEDLRAALALVNDTRTYSGRGRVRCADGTYRHMAFSIKPLESFGGDGGAGAHVSSWRDNGAEVAAENALNESEAYFRLAMHRAAIGMAITAPDGTFASVNPSLCRMVGYSEAELIGMRFADLTYPDDLPLGLQGIRDMVAGVTQTFSQRKRYVAKNGSIVWVDLSAVAVRGADGSYRNAVSQFVDVTAEVVNFEAMQRGARQFRLLAENTSDVVYLTDRQGTIQWISPSVAAVLGHDAELLIGSRATSLVQAEDVAIADQARIDIFDGRAVSPVIVRFRTVAGPYREMETTGRAIRSATGDITGVAVSLRDVVAELSARRKLARSEEQFRLAMASAPQGMALTDTDGVLIQVNQALCDLLAEPEAELLGRGLFEFLAGDEMATYMQQVTVLMVDHAEAQRSERVLVSGDTRVWVDHAMSLLRDDMRRPVFLVHHFADVTQARMAKDELQYLVRHDGLSGVLNRYGLVEQLQALFEGNAGLQEPLGLLFIDIDRFKILNDTHGHSAGDAVIVALAQRLVNVVRDGDLVARWGGDEFVVVLRKVADEAILRRVANDVLVAGSQQVEFVLNRDIGLDGQTVERVPPRAADIADDVRLEVGVSVGGVLSRPGETFDQFLTRGDDAMYQVKESGRGQVSIGG